MKRLIVYTLMFSLMISASSAFAQRVLEYSAFNGKLKLYSAKTNYGQGEVTCPSGSLALGGGSHCSDGDFDVSYPIRVRRGRYDVPVGWREWHRGASSNDCKVYVICVPEDWFDADEIIVVRGSTDYGQGLMLCPRAYKAVSGGSFCSYGDFDVAHPLPDLDGWAEWHRGASSNDCEVYAVCVSEDNWIGDRAYRVSKPTGYGQGSVSCLGDIAIGGGSFCTDGDFDVTYPLSNLSGWAEHHRGASSNDCTLYGVCLPR